MGKPAPRMPGLGGPRFVETLGILPGTGVTMLSLNPIQSLASLRQEQNINETHTHRHTINLKKTKFSVG